MYLKDDELSLSLNRLRDQKDHTGRVWTMHWWCIFVWIQAKSKKITSARLCPMLMNPTPNKWVNESENTSEAGALCWCLYRVCSRNKWQDSIPAALTSKQPDNRDSLCYLFPPAWGSVQGYGVFSGLGGGVEWGRETQTEGIQGRQSGRRGGREGERESTQSRART